MASDGDLPGIRELVAAALTEFGMAIDLADIDSDLASIERSCNNAGGRFWVLTERTGRVVGTVGMLKLDDATCELRKMYLSPDWRGKGWGKLMLAEAVSFARSAHFRKVTLDTHSTMATAMALYRSFGFRELPPSECHCGRCDVAFELEL
jgi:putative acetyltransferase